MKFIVSSTQLLRDIQVLGGIINTNNTLPILDNFLFELSKNNLKITVSDLETTMSTNIEVESEDEMEIAVPARLLLDILKTFPEQPLTFKTDGKSTIEISLQSGKYSLAYLEGDEFPKAIELESPSTTKIVGSVLSKAISKTIFSAAINEEMKPVLNGVLFELSTDNLTFVATNAHKLVKYTRTDLKSDKDSSFVMPKKPLNLLKNILSNSENEVTIEYNESNAKFIFAKSIMVCRLIDGVFPNYDAVIPKENPNILTLERASFSNSVKRVAIFSSKTTHRVRLKIAGTELNISAEDIDFSNKANERLQCAYQGDDMEIGFNSKFLLEMLNNLESNDIQIRMSLPNRAGVLRPLDGLEEGEEVTMLVMPVMLSN